MPNEKENLIALNLSVEVKQRAWLQKQADERRVSISLVLREKLKQLMQEEK